MHLNLRKIGEQKFGSNNSKIERSMDNKLNERKFFSNGTTYLLEVIPISDGVHDRSQLFVNGEFQSHAREGSEDIRKQNASISLVVSPRLKGNLYGDIRNFTTLTEGGVFFAKITVFLDVATSLSHHPNGGTFRLFATSSTDQKWVLSFASGRSLFFCCFFDGTVNGRHDAGRRVTDGEGIAGLQKGKKKNCTRPLHCIEDCRKKSILVTMKVWYRDLVEKCPSSAVFFEATREGQTTGRC